jgi:hypothetical protein
VGAEPVGVPTRSCSSQRREAAGDSGSTDPSAWLAVTVSDQILGVLVGGGVAIVSGLVVAFMTERRGRGEWRRQARLTSAGKTMRALQVVNREITNLAISKTSTIDGTGSEWLPYHAAAIDWNSARHEAALIAPQEELKLLAKLDREQDRLLEVAVLKRWDPSNFRRERAQLGELAGEYIRVARSTAGEGATDLPSLWSWASDMEEATRPPGASVAKEHPRPASVPTSAVILTVVGLTALRARLARRARRSDLVGH